MTNKEQFEKWWKIEPPQDAPFDDEDNATKYWAEASWQARGEVDAKRIAELEARNKELVEALSITVNNISIATAGHGIKPIDIKKVLTPAWEALANQPTKGKAYD